MNKKDQYEYIHEYTKRTYKSYLIRIRIDDEETIRKLEEEPSVNGYILKLIHKDIWAGR